MESDKNFSSVVYAAGLENLRPFQRRMCSYFCLAAAGCFHVWVATSLGECLSPSRVYLSLSRPSLSLSRPFSLVSVLAIVCCGCCDLEIQSASNIKRQRSTTTNKQLDHRTPDQLNSPIVCVCVCTYIQATVVPDPTSTFISTHHKRLQQA
jgi:hypothetical protein